MGLQVTGLRARHGRIEVCRDITFNAGDGEFLIVLGPNGAGKSSLLGALAGSVDSDGEVLLDGRALQQLPARRRARLGLALVPEGRRNLFSPLTVEENMQLGLRLLPVAEHNAMRSSLQAMFPILSSRASQPAGLLSGGEQQMLAIAVALAPVILEHLVELIGGLRSLGLTVVLAEQNHRFAARLADRYVVLQGGEIVGGGTGDELNDRERAAAALMGH